jgi:hypothetical protein
VTIVPSELEALTDETVNLILSNNETIEALCGGDD